MKRLISACAIVALSVGAFGADAAFAKDKNEVVAGPASISAKDKAVGAEAHPQLLQEFGGLYNGRQAAYVTQVGQKIAVQSGLSNAKGDFTISLLNSSVNNAFAIPGGYVYVTRQLLGLMNDEAELASVMGHEVGHVAAQHSKKRSNRATKGALGSVLLTVLGAAVGGSDGAKLGQQLGSSIAQRYVLGYSRSQEYQADDLGVSYLAKAGYDPMASSTMLASLAAQTSLDARRSGRSEKALPEWASTHPDPASRVARARQTAAASGGTSTYRNNDGFISMLDGMLYDDDPEQGIVDGQTFRHPGLRLGFTAPTGFAISNGTSAVTINGSGGQAQFSGGPYAGDMNSYITSVFKGLSNDPNAQLNIGSVSQTTINGLKTGVASTNANTQSGAVTVTVYAYEFGPKSAFHVMTVTPAGSGTGPFSSLVQSVHRLSDQEVASIKARRIDIVTVRSSDTLQSISNRMAYTDYQVERFLTLNGLAANSALKSGQKVKIIVYAAK